MSDQNAARAIEHLGVTATIPDGALVSDAIILIKYVEEDGTIGMRVSCNPGGSWLERIGMLRSALLTEEADLASTD